MACVRTQRGLTVSGMQSDDERIEWAPNVYQRWERLRELREGTQPTKDEIRDRWGVPRDTRGLTKAEAARRADMSPQLWGNIEHGQRRATPKHLQAIADALDVSVGDLGEQPPVPQRKRRPPHLRPNFGRSVAGRVA